MRNGYSRRMKIPSKKWGIFSPAPRLLGDHPASARQRVVYHPYLPIITGGIRLVAANAPPFLDGDNQRNWDAGAETPINKSSRDYGSRGAGIKKGTRFLQPSLAINR